MARDTATLLAQLLRFLPPGYAASEALLGGLAEQYAQVEQLGDELVGSVTVEGAEGKWLTLLARGYGIYRRDGESDESVRERLREVEDAVTPTAILIAVNRLLAPYTATEAELLEHWDYGFFADVDFADQPDDETRVLDQHLAFTLLVPHLTASGTTLGHFAVAPADATDPDAAFADGDTYAVVDTVDDTEHAVYSAIQSAVERLRAAGVRWWLLRDEP